MERSNACYSVRLDQNQHQNEHCNTLLHLINKKIQNTPLNKHEAQLNNFMQSKVLGLCYLVLCDPVHCKQSVPPHIQSHICHRQYPKHD